MIETFIEKDIIFKDDTAYGLSILENITIEKIIKSKNTPFSFIFFTKKGMFLIYPESYSTGCDIVVKKVKSIKEEENGNKKNKK